MIDIVDYDTLKAMERSLDSARGESPDSTRPRWQGFHDELREIAGRYGEVVGSPAESGDVIAPGEWSHLETDRFILRTLKLVDPSALVDLRGAVAGHHPNGSLLIEGEAGGPLADLLILIGPTVVLLAWRNSSAEECRLELEKLGIEVDA